MGILSTSGGSSGGGGTLPDPVTFPHGGTGQTTQQAALDAIAAAVTANQVLAGDGTHVTLRALLAADIPSLPASQITSGTMATARLGSGTASSHTLLGGDQAYHGRPEILYSAGSFPNVNTITTSASLLGGAIAGAIPASLLQVGDLLHFHANGAINNTSGSSAIVGINLAIAGTTDGLLGTATMASGNSGNWNIETWAIVTTAAGVALDIFMVSVNAWFSPTSNALVLANTKIRPTSGWVSTTFTYNVANTIDVVANTTVNNANMGFNCLGVALQRFPAG